MSYLRGGSSFPTLFHVLEVRENPKNTMLYTSRAILVTEVYIPMIASQTGFCSDSIVFLMGVLKEDVSKTAGHPDAPSSPILAKAHSLAAFAYWIKCNP